MTHKTGVWGSEAKARSKKRLEYFREYRKKHPQSGARRSRKYVYKWKKRLFQTLGNKCKFCGFDDVRALQIDHIHGGGRKDRDGRSPSGNCYWKRVLESIENNENKYQLLCANCNFIKRYTNNECTGPRKKVDKV